MPILKQLKRALFVLFAVPISVTMGLSIGSSPAFAQDDDEEDALDEIVVTSRYREERLQSTPIAITAMTGADLEIPAFTSAYEVAYSVPTRRCDRHRPHSATR